VNRRRDDFTCKNDVVTSTRGVFRTHTRKGKPIFAQALKSERAEHILSNFYDPYHDGLRSVIEKVHSTHGQVLLLDMHTASPHRIGDHEVVVGTRGGATGDRKITERIVDLIAASGVEVHEDVPGYAGGHIVRRYGEDGGNDIHAIQVEINAGLLMTTPRETLIPLMIRGGRPEIDTENVERMRRCLETIVKDVMA
jgi:N-formylglutamate deformylase